MNGKQLRNSILQWAISGRLVPQDPNDEPAIALLRRINPKAAPLSPDDAPFTVPDSWCWCRLGDVGNIVTGSTPSKSIKEYYEGNIPFFKPTDLEQGINVCEASDHLSEKGYKQARQLPPNSVLVTCIGATIGKTGLTSVAGTCNQQINAIVPNNVVLPLYVYFACVSDCIQTKIKTNASATTLPILNKGNFARLPFPLPPLAEQERIVRKVEELLPLVERYDKAQTELDRLNASLKGKLRASVLQEAISGRLVPQDPNDEPATALLRRINPKFTPQPTDSPLPPGWTACTLEDIVEIKDNLRQPINSAERNKRVAGKKDSELYPYYGATGQVGYIDNYLMDGKYLLLGEDGAPFLDKMATKAYIVEGKCWVNNHAHVLLPHCNTEYMCLYLNQFAYYGYVTGSTRLKLTQASMKKMPVLVPPLAEQERIVGKVEELFAVLDALH